MRFPYSVPNKRGAGGDDGTGRVRASPVARFHAKQRGINLAHISGTGPEGRIVEADVLAFANRTPASSVSSSTPPELGVGGAERRIVLALIAFTLLVSTLPYALGYYLAPYIGRGNSTFIGTAYN
ncbi:MAG: E3 binding domain-containing protein, partial [Armatimonadota bacterium]|nr:E3 binding domain-containing protein [Armatimonadota bacterium]